MVHQRVIQHVGRKLARFSPLPPRELKRRSVAPWLERKFLVDNTRKARGPFKARKGCDGLFDERRADKVPAAKPLISNVKGGIPCHLHADIVYDGCKLEYLPDGGDVAPCDEDVLVANDGL